MLNTKNTTDEIAPISTDGMKIPDLVCFCLYLLFEVPSIICSIFVLSHLLFNRELRRALCNHVIILLIIINLIVQLTNIPWILNYYRLFSVRPATHIFCILWIFTDEGLYITTTIFFAWATVERHILIFHDRWVSTRIKRRFIHYFPIGFLSLYCLCYSLVVIILPPCKNIFDYTQVVCGYPLCYYENASVALWDVVVNDMIPTVIIILCSVTLFGRVLYQKKRVRQPIRWRKHRKMAIQLLSISCLYLILYIPRLILEFAYRSGVSQCIGANFMVYAKFFSYCGNFLFPFVCGGSLPNLKVKIKNIFPCWRRQARAIAPEVFHIHQKVEDRFVKGPVIVR
jgi:hypothetical protein